MKKHNLFSKATLSLITVVMSVTFFAGCQDNKDTSSTSQTSSTQNSSTSSETKDKSTTNGTKSTEEDMKKQTQESIQPLVTAGTITQVQADKIVESLATRPVRNKQNAPKSQNDEQNNSQEKPKNDSQGERINPLTQLIADGTITQAQADAVMEKVRGNFKKINNGQGNQDNTTQSTKTNNGQSSN